MEFSIFCGHNPGCLRGLHDNGSHLKKKIVKVFIPEKYQGLVNDGNVWEFLKMQRPPGVELQVYDFVKKKRVENASRPHLHLVRGPNDVFVREPKK